MDVQAVIDVVEALAPPWLADEGDPIGLQTGSRQNAVTHVLVTVDVTPSVIDQAVASGGEMIVSHHALIYAPLRSLERTDAGMDAIARLVADDISVFTAHTNYDCAPGGMNDVLAQTLGVTQTEIMAVRRTEPLFTISVFTPPEAVSAVHSAMSTAGAGAIGDYSECSFRAKGKGTFRPLEGADPYSGKVGELEEVEEYRLEMVVHGSLLSQAVEAMLSAHPYEEVAYSVYRMENSPRNYGLGRVGTLSEASSLAMFAALVEERLGVRGLRMVGDPNRRVERVAVCGGGGDFLIPDAHAAGADVYVTGTAGYHRLLEAEALEMAFIDAGHFETERPGMQELALRLQREFVDEPVEIRFVD